MLSRRSIPAALRFRGWSRKSYAAFYSVGRHITIGRLKSVVADTLLGKQTNRLSAVSTTEQPSAEEKEEVSEPPDRDCLLLRTLLASAGIISRRVAVTPGKEYLAGNIFTYRRPIAFAAIGHFIFQTLFKSPNKYKHEKKHYYISRNSTGILQRRPAGPGTNP